MSGVVSSEGAGASASGAGSAHHVAEVDEDQLSVGSVDFDTEVTLLEEMDGW